VKRNLVFLIYVALHSGISADGQQTCACMHMASA